MFVDRAVVAIKDEERQAVQQSELYKKRLRVPKVRRVKRLVAV